MKTPTVEKRSRREKATLEKFFLFVLFLFHLVEEIYCVKKNEMQLEFFPFLHAFMYKYIYKYIQIECCRKKDIYLTRRSNLTKRRSDMKISI